VSLTDVQQVVRHALIFPDYSFNGMGVGLGGLIGFAIGHIKGALQSWRYEFLVVGAVCSAWGISLSYTLSNSPTRHRWFTHDERLMIIARLKKNQTGIENRVINWKQIREAFLDYKTWIFFSLGLIGVGDSSPPCASSLTLSR
jgi:MFS family permease